MEQGTYDKKKCMLYTSSIELEKDENAIERKILLSENVPQRAVFTREHTVIKYSYIIPNINDNVGVRFILNDKANYEVFNFGSGEKTDVITIAKTLIEKYHSKVKYKISGNYRVGDIKDNEADLTKIKTLLGYKPKVKFKEGISKFVDWVERQEVEKDNYLASIEEMKKKGLYK